MAEYVKFEQSATTHLAVIQRLAQIGSWVFELKTGELKWSKEVFCILEIDKSQFRPTYEAFLNLVHPDDRGLLDDTYKNSVRTKTPYRLAHRLIMKDGRIKYVVEQGETDYDESGEPIRSIGTVQDRTSEITSLIERDEARLDLELAERLAKFGHYKLVRGEEIFMLSDGGHAVIGTSKNEFIPSIQNALQIIHPDDRADFEGMINDTFGGQESATLVARVKRKDGSYSWVEGFSRPIFAPDGTVSSLFGIMHDVSERHEIQLRLQEHAQRYEMVELVVNDGIWDWNILAKQIYVSPRYKAILGYQPSDLIVDEADIFASVHPDDQGMVKQAAHAHFEQCIPFNVELRRRHKDGGYRWVRCRASALRDSKNVAIRMLGSMTDITLEKDALEARRIIDQSAGLQSAIREAPVAIAMFDTQMCYLSASNRWCDYVYGTSSELDKLSNYDLSHALPRRWREAFKQALNLNTAQLLNEPSLQKDGTVSWLNWTLRA